MPGCKYLVIFVSVLLIFACTTGPRLGFPVKSFTTPVPVTLFSSINVKGQLTKDMDIFGRESWRMFYDKKYLEMLSKVNVPALGAQMDELFLIKSKEIEDLFTIKENQVFHGVMEYSKNQDDPENYSGYDFSRLIDNIPTKYILALTVNEWGYLATKDPRYTGPYMDFTIQLIDKETSLSMWQFSKRYWKQIIVSLGYEEPIQVQLSDIDYTMTKIIPRALNDIFAWLK
ncbi:MAG: hypothetical protein JXD23_16345 [Spirochaetales bacterium]|nr:hypothetical protein [Spirochaetales bacterium]